MYKISEKKVFYVISGILILFMLSISFTIYVNSFKSSNIDHNNIKKVISNNDEFSTYIGGNSSELGENPFSYAYTDLFWGVIDSVVDNEGNIILLGKTSSPDFPITEGVFQTNLSGNIDLVIVKMNQQGSLIFSSFLGGSDLEIAGELCIDSSNNIIITGTTQSDDFPVTDDAIYSSYLGNQDIIITKIDSDGTEILYSTYYGSDQREFCYAATLDSQENLFIAGLTSSHEFPVTENAFQDTVIAITEGYIVKFDKNMNLLLSTYIGGHGNHYITSISTDSEDNLITCGSTATFDMPLIEPFQDTHGGSTDGYIMKFDNNVEEIVFSTYMGGEIRELYYDLAIDSSDNIYAVGSSYSDDYPTKNAIQSTLASEDNYHDVIFAKFDPTGKLLFSSYLGGTGHDIGYSIVLDDNENGFIITGVTNSNDFPGINESVNIDSTDMFITIIDLNGKRIQETLIIGGSNEDTSTSICYYDESIIFAGFSNSIDIVNINAYQASLGGEEDLFICKKHIDVLEYSVSTPGFLNIVTLISLVSIIIFSKNYKL